MIVKQKLPRHESNISQIRSSCGQCRKVVERIEYLKKYGDNIYKGKVLLNDIIKELEVLVTFGRKYNE